MLFQKGSISYTKRWLGGVIRRSNAFEDGIPWFNFFAIDWLTSYVDTSMRVFEWGSGGSTLYWAGRVHHVVSIEHDHSWLSRVAAALQERHFRNVDLRYVPSEESGSVSSSDVEASCATLVPDVFREYSAQINTYPDEWFDIIVVDGRDRLRCLRNAASKVRQGGLIILDNSDWYEQGLAWFDPTGWEMQHFRGPGPTNQQVLSQSRL
ncbi:MAG: hypothetical protein M5U05_19405 [Anaerolineales bacterium]|nr:hypothetical protein [Anaerolineales bacterium]